jgi:hypothetical protein
MLTEKTAAESSIPSVRPTDPSAKDAGKVRLGGQAPSLPPVRTPSKVTADHGNVRLGGQMPSL